MYNYYPQQYAGGSYMQPQPQQYNSVSGLKGRPVSSIEEVRAAQIDFDGSLFIFPDIANHRIYTKKVCMDGSAELNTYELIKTPVTTPTNESIQLDNFVTKQELNEVIEQLKASLAQTKDPKPAQPLNFIGKEKCQERI